MAQAKQGYFKTTNANKFERKKHYGNRFTQKSFFSAGYANDKPKKLYQTSLYENSAEDRNSKPNSKQVEFQSTHQCPPQAAKSIQEGVIEETNSLKDCKNRKYSRDSANDSTSNDESYYSPISVQKPKGDNFKIKYKTELCKYFEINGQCKFGDNCAYAHGKENLRSKVTNSTAYRTKKCLQFFEIGFCPYGNRCQFAHALKSNIINNPYDKSMSYARTLKMLSKKENIGNMKTFFAKPRLPFLETIAKEEGKSTLFDDIKSLTEEYKRIDE